MTVEGSFIWHELVTGDAAAASRFYQAVVGWQAVDSGLPGMAYTVLQKDGIKMAGLMGAPGGEAAMPTAWSGYVAVADVDACARKVAAAGGAILRAPDDIEAVGRFAVVADPQGAVFNLFCPLPGGDPPAGTTMRDGAVGWNELLAPDPEKALAFYCGVFGWEVSRTLDMGEMGGYHLFATSAGGGDAGGVMACPAGMSGGWRFYVSVASIDAATAAVTDNGGVVQLGPMEVPGGMWVINARDPQGAAFGLVGPR